MSSPLLRLIIACGVLTTTACLRSSLYRGASEEDAEEGVEEELIPVSPPQLDEGSHWVALQSTDTIYCALSRSGEVWCWGSNVNGSLGYDTTPDTHAHTPRQVEGLPPMAALLLDDTRMSCARTVTGEVWCWGEVSAPGLDADTAAKTSSRAIEIFSQDKSFGANRFGFCHLDMQHHVTCQQLQYTSNENDGPSITYGLSWQPLEGREVTQLVTGDAHFCATSRGKVWCWGEPGPGALGTSLHDTDAREAVPLAGLHHIVELSTRGDRTCARRIDGAAWCWGGSVEVDEQSREVFPLTRMEGLERAVALSSSGKHVCAVNEAGELICDRRTESIPELRFLEQYLMDPSVIFTGERVVVDLTSSAQSSCVLNAADEVWCMGRNDHNELGILNKTGTFLPQAFREFQPARELFMLEGKPCALLDEPAEKIVCWGNLKGSEVTYPWFLWELLMIGTPAPFSARALTQVTNACAVHDETTISCLQENYDEPIFSMNASGPIAQISYGAERLCARLQSGEVECWDTTRSPAEAIEPISKLTDAIDLDARQGDVCVVRQDGEIDCLNNQTAIVNQRELLGELGATAPLPHAATVSSTGGSQRCLLTPPPVQAWCWNTAPLEEALFGPPLWQIAEVPPESEALHLFSQEDMGCVTLKGGGLSCWGEGSRHLFGYDFEAQRAREIPWAGDLTGSLLLTPDFGCGIFGEKREVRCWGSNAHGELGWFPRAYSAEAVQVHLPRRPG